jgi:hypothetical protein
MRRWRGTDVPPRKSAVVGFTGQCPFLVVGHGCGLVTWPANRLCDMRSARSSDRSRIYEGTGSYVDEPADNLPYAVPAS